MSGGYQSVEVIKKYTIHNNRVIENVDLLKNVDDGMERITGNYNGQPIDIYRQSRTPKLKHVRFAMPQPSMRKMSRRIAMRMPTPFVGRHVTTVGRRRRSSANTPRTRSRGRGKKNNKGSK
jgi:hypothetical protein